MLSAGPTSTLGQSELGEGGTSSPRCCSVDNTVAKSRAFHA